MMLIPRRGILPVFLIAFLAAVLFPCSLHAQSTASDAANATANTTKKAAKKTKDAATSTANSATTTTENAASATEKGTKKAANATAAESKKAASATASGTKTAASKTNEAVTGNSHAQTPPQPGMVWVNTSSKIYHKSGSRYYGNTKQGKWMTEADAQKAGYKAAKD